MAAALAAANEREARVNEFLATQQLPGPIKQSYAAANTYEEVVTSISIRQIVTAEPPAAPEFIEAPPSLSDLLEEAKPPVLGMPSTAQISLQPRQVTGWPNIVGQDVRLEAELKSLNGVDIGLNTHAKINLSLLLGRVVDAAVLADAYVGRQHDIEPDTTPTFFSRIYLERIEPGLYWKLQQRLHKASGRAVARPWGYLPARVVIETQYPNTFPKVLLQGANAKDELVKSLQRHFGIAIEVRSPRKRREGKLENASDDAMPMIERLRNWWNRVFRKADERPAPKPAKLARAGKAQVLCRAMKSKVSGGLHAPLSIHVAGRDTEVNIQIATAGLIASKCKSRWLAAKTKGVISQAPNIFLLSRGPTVVPHEFCGEKLAACPYLDARPKWALAVPADGSVQARDLDKARWPLVAKWEVGAWWDDSVGLIRFPSLLCHRRALLSDRLNLSGVFITRGKDVEALVVSSSGPQEAPHTVVDMAHFSAYLVQLMLGVLNSQRRTPATEPVTA